MTCINDQHRPRCHSFTSRWSRTIGNEHPTVVVIGAMHVSFMAPVPSLFRLMLISTAKRREPLRNEIPAQKHDRRSTDRHQKFDLYFDRPGSLTTQSYQCGSRLLPWPRGQ
jgi:hypothetical protein